MDILTQTEPDVNTVFILPDEEAPREWGAIMPPTEVVSTEEAMAADAENLSYAAWLAIWGEKVAQEIRYE